MKKVLYLTLVMIMVLNLMPVSLSVSADSLEVLAYDFNTAATQPTTIPSNWKLVNAEQTGHIDYDTSETTGTNLALMSAGTVNPSWEIDLTDKNLTEKTTFSFDLRLNTTTTAMNDGSYDGNVCIEAYSNDGRIFWYQFKAPNRLKHYARILGRTNNSQKVLSSIQYDLNSWINYEVVIDPATNKFTIKAGDYTLIDNLDCAMGDAGTDEITKITKLKFYSRSATTANLLIDNLKVVKGDAVTQFTVKFVNPDGTVISSQKVNSGEDAVAPENPTYDPGDGKIYTFKGWDKSFTNITEDTTVTAQYDVAVNSNILKYDFNSSASQPSTIPSNWKLVNAAQAGYIDYDSAITTGADLALMSAGTVDPSWEIDLTDKNLTDKTTFSFDLRLNTTTTATNDGSYDGNVCIEAYSNDGRIFWYQFKASNSTQYLARILGRTNSAQKMLNNKLDLNSWIKYEVVIDPATNKFTINAGDYTLIDNLDCALGETGTDEITQITKLKFYSRNATTANLMIDNLEIVRGDAKETFTVEFVNPDGTVISSQKVKSGEDAVAPENPTYDPGDGKIYTFTGWDKTFTNITENTTVTAQYNAVLKREVVAYDFNTAASQPSTIPSNWKLVDADTEGYINYDEATAAGTNLALMSAGTVNPSFVVDLSSAELDSTTKISFKARLNTTTTANNVGSYDGNICIEGYSSDGRIFWYQFKSKNTSQHYARILGRANSPDKVMSDKGFDLNTWVDYEIVINPSTNKFTIKAGDYTLIDNLDCALGNDGTTPITKVTQLKFYSRNATTANLLIDDISVTRISSDTSLAVKTGFVYNVDNDAHKVTKVVDGTTVASLILGLETDGGTIKVYNSDKSVEKIPVDIVEDGDILVVTAEDGSTTQDYTVSVTEAITIKFYNSNNEEVTSLVNHTGSLTAKATIINDDISDKFVLIVACYKTDGSIASAPYRLLNVQIGQNKEETVTLTQIPDGTTKIKAFVWEDLDSIRPIGRHKEL